MKRALLVLSLMLFGTAPAQVTLQQAVDELRGDIRQESERLVQVRAELAAARREQSQALAERENRVAALRDELERARRVRRQGNEAAQRQRQELEQARQQEAELRALSREARRSLETRISPALATQIQAQLQSIDLSLRDPGPEAASRAALATLKVFEDSLRLLDSPQRFPSAVILPDGRERNGSLLLLGPVAWFAEDAGGERGLISDRGPGSAPGLYPIDSPAIDDVLRGERREIPFDLSSGKALVLSAAAKPWTERLKEGGVTMIPLVLTAIAALIIVVLKTLSLLQVRGRDPERLRAFATELRSGDASAARARASAAPEPLRSLLEGVLAHAHATAEELEEILHERMLGLIPRLDRHLGTLAVLGGIAPLLGLLGTVTGMIRTFELVTLFGSGNARILSQGISEALVTTMAGLSIAIPVLLAHAFLSRRVRVILGELEQSIAALVQLK